MKLEQVHSVYFIGIGGIGMSALARWFMLQGKQVYGYDRTATLLTQELIQEGAHIHYTDDVAYVQSLALDKSTTMVIITPAVPKNHQEWQWFTANDYTIKKRSEVLGDITNTKFNIAVAGTHGKTTTSSMIAHIIKSSGSALAAFLGGLASNYNSNLILEKPERNDLVMLAEADEFDRSFLRLKPDIAVVTSADADHLDIYGDHQSLTASFRDFVKNIKPGGKLIIHDSISYLANEAKHLNIFTYGINRGQFFACNPMAKGGFFEFDLQLDKSSAIRFKAGVPGFHNIENAIAAILVARELGIVEDVIKKSIESFKGVKRRFEFIIDAEDLVFIDDYAHHPVEITALLTSIRAMYPERKLTVIFQPHLFSRTRDFAVEFSRSLSIADQVILLDIYPARELPIVGVSAAMLLDEINTEYKVQCNKDELLTVLEDIDIEVLATVGAGDIDLMVEPIKQFLNQKYAA